MVIYQKRSTIKFIYPKITVKQRFKGEVTIMSAGSGRTLTLANRAVALTELQDWQFLQNFVMIALS